MIHKRLSIYMVLTLVILVSQFAPFGKSVGVAAAGPCNSAGFIADVTVPDSSVFQPGAAFVKTWRLKNTGTCTWTSEYGLAFVSGDLLGATSSKPMPSVAPGQQVDISLDMNAPTTPGHYRGYWMLKDAQGNKFGLGTNADKSLWVDINVSSPSPTGGTILDFTKEMCTARWMSGAGQLPCPLTEGDARGFVLTIDHPKLENGITDSAPGLLVSPQNKYNGYIQGFYPEITVQRGDIFQTSVGCAYGSSCYVTYRLDYQINNGAIKILWSWSEKNEGKIYQLNKDLSALAGQKVRFILTLLAAGSATKDRAVWGQPLIVRSSGSIPTSTPITPIPTTLTPTVTVSPAPPSTGSFLDFAADPCSASWKSGAGALPCPGTDGDARGFILPVTNPKLENGVTDNASALILFPQNKYDGYIQGTYPEVIVQKGDRFQSIVGCAYGSSCYVTFRLDYLLENGLQVKYWTWAEKNEGKYYRVDKDISALAGKKVKFILMLLATGPATGDRALWSQPRIVRQGTNPPTPTPTGTVTTQGDVTEVRAAVKVPEFVNCAGTLNVELLGSITANGPATVKYHWEISGTTNQVLAESTLVFSSASTQPANVTAYPLNCGSYAARLVVTSPNAVSAQADFSLSMPTRLPIYDFKTFTVIGTMGCSEVANYTWRQEACNGESGGCWISQTPLFENSYAGFFRHDGNTICELNIP